MSKLARKSLIIISSLVILLVLLFVFFPSFLLKRTFNQDYSEPDSVLASIRTDDVSVSLFLDEINLKNIVLTPKQGQTTPVIIGSARVTNLNPWKVIKTSFGFRGDSFDLLSESEVVLRDINTADEPEAVLKIHAGTLSLENFFQDYTVTNMARVDQLSFQSLKFTDLNISVSNDSLVFKSEGLSFLNLKSSFLGALVVSTLSLNSSAHEQSLVSVDNARVSNIDLISFYSGLDRALVAKDALGFFTGLNEVTNALGSLDLASLSIFGTNDEFLFIRKAIIDQLGVEGDLGEGKVTIVEDLNLNMDELGLFIKDAPMKKAIFDSLDKKSVINFKSTSRNKEAKLNGSFDLGVKDKIDINLLYSIDNPPSSLNILSLFTSLPKLGLGRGELEITDHSFLSAFSQNLSQNFYGGQSTAEFLKPYLANYLTYLIDPNPDNRPFNKDILEIELNGFLSNPQSLKISFDPIPGYPMAVLEDDDSNLANLALSPNVEQKVSALAEKYKYAMIRELNLTLEANGRAPVSVYLDRPGAPLPSSSLELPN
ncbi:MAG: hypothetical protein LBF38_08035 [Deltaproteobacteria bacterium]|jgi:hypothetical protein|nr:hypothetical protein [Deltaproteobacteria bacterium]